MKKILSYLYPIIKKIKTEHNGTVELVYSNGKKLLDSASANYSYGSLQCILKFALKQIDLEKVNHVLLLGLGGGSVIQTLRLDFGFAHQITAVEFDKTIIDIALNEFGLKEDKNLEIIEADALSYVKNRERKFDLIIIDLFIDSVVPNVFYSIDFWKNIHLLTAKNGHIIFNASTSNHDNIHLSELISLLDKYKLFSIQQHDLVEDTNTIIVGKKNGSPKTT